MAKVYIEKERVDHIFVKNSTGSALERGDFVSGHETCPLALGCCDLKKIAALSARELAKHRGVGKKKIAKLRALLQNKGLDLKE